MQSSEFSRVFLLSMSNSEVYLIPGDHQEAAKIDQEFAILKKIPTTAAARDDELRNNIDNVEIIREKKCEKKVDVEDEDDDERRRRMRRGLVELEAMAVDDHDRDGSDHDYDDDGFKTPTSSDHKIPAIQQCPPAPRKPKPPKRKTTSSSDVRRNILLDLSREVEAMFPQPMFDDWHRKIKKARIDQDN